MKNKKSQRVLGRTANHRLGLFKQLTSDVLAYGSIETTLAKAKELKKIIEPLITEAKSKETLHGNRNLITKLGSLSEVKKLRAVANSNAKRSGGYTRITKLHNARHDNAPTARLDIIDAKDAK